MDHGAGLNQSIGMEDLQALRQAIDEHDRAMIEALVSRFQTVRSVAALKSKSDLTVVQPDRMKEVERNYVEFGRQHQLSADFMQRLYHLIHEESCRMQKEIGNTTTVSDAIRDSDRNIPQDTTG